MPKSLILRAPGYFALLSLYDQERGRIEAAMRHQHRVAAETSLKEASDRLEGIEAEKQKLVCRVMEAEAEAERQRFPPVVYILYFIAIRSKHAFEKFLTSCSCPAYIILRIQAHTMKMRCPTVVTSQTFCHNGTFHGL